MSFVQLTRDSKTWPEGSSCLIIFSKFQCCDDMFIYSKWNGSTTYHHGENKRDFGTDYGICCWYTPQLNFRFVNAIFKPFLRVTQISLLTCDCLWHYCWCLFVYYSAIPWGPDTDWNYWFGTVKKGAKTGKDNGFSVLFDIESFDYGYYDEGSEGLKVWNNVFVLIPWLVFVSIHFLLVR